MMIRAALFGLAMALASPAAKAMDLEPIQGATIALGEVAGVAYYTVEPNGHRVVATFAAADSETPVRFEAVLADGQELVVSVPGAIGSKAEEVVIARRGDRVSIVDAPVLIAADSK